MNLLELRLSRRESPHLNLGGDSADAFQDFVVDGAPLLPWIKQVIGEHLDVVTMLTPDVPSAAVDVLEGLLDPDQFTDVGANPGEVTLYTCPVDFDLLCGGVVASVERSVGLVRWFRFRHVYFDEGDPAAGSDLTARMAGLEFVFAADQYDTLLRGELARFKALEVTHAALREQRPSRWWDLRRRRR